MRGVNAWDYSSSFLTNNCITNHIQEGLYCDLAEIRLHNMNTYGSNIISSNGGYQIRVLFEGYVEGGYPLGNGLAHGRDNKIVPLSPNDRRISAYYATAFNLFNWWDMVPDSCSGGKYGNFSTQQYSQLVDTSLYAVVIIDTALCDSQYITHSCDDHSSCYSGSIVARMDDAPIIRDNQSNAEPAFRKSLSINMKLIFVNFLKHVKKEQFNDAYQLVDQLFQLNAHEDIIASFTKLLLDHEIAYARAHPDSTEKCFTRIKSFMNQKHALSNNNEIKAALLRMLAHTAFLFGDISLAQQKSIQLRNTYPASRFAKHNLWLEQLIAMAKRDTVGVDTTIARMTKAGYSSSELRVAERMKYGFLRVKQKELVSKRIGEQDESRIQKSVDELLALTRLNNYPNPFNPSTIIEFYLPQTSHITLKVYSILGKEIQTLVDDVLKKGNHATNFTASHNLQSGIFIYVLTTEWGNVISRMMYIK